MNDYLKFLAITASLIGPSALMAKESNYVPYVFKKGDNLSEVLHRHELSPLYGKDEWVQKVLKLNRLSGESAKKMKAGDVVVLPLKSTIFVGSAYEDSVKSIESAAARRSVESFRSKSSKSSYDGLRLGAEIFYQDYSYDNGPEVSVNQNIKVFAEYQKRKNNTDDSIVFEPRIQLGVYAQSQADFDNNENLSADFTPSIYANTALEIRQKNWNVSLAPLVEYENFTALYRNNGNFRVDREQIIWGGLEASKYFERKRQTYFLSARYQRGNELGAELGQVKVGAIFNKHYKVEFNASQRNLDLDDNATINSYGLNLGYNF